MSSGCYWQKALSLTTRSWGCYEKTNFGDLCPETKTAKNQKGIRETPLLIVLWTSPQNCLWPCDNNHIWLSKIPKQALSFSWLPGNSDSWKPEQLRNNLFLDYSGPWTKEGIQRFLETKNCTPVSLFCPANFCHLRSMPNQARIWGLYQLGMERFFLDINFR